MRQDTKNSIFCVSVLFIGVMLISGGYANPFNMNRAKLLAQAPNLKPKILDKALAIYRCVKRKKVRHEKYLTLIDFTKPSNEKRLWLFDLDKNKLIYYTWVAHGMNSGVLYAKYFSNKPQSRTSSLGLYKTGVPYKGKHGDSLRLHGLEQGYNDKAFSRSVVVHGAWYISEEFIKKYGRIGRSWGCPAVKMTLAKPIVNLIKHGSLLLIYYPNNMWMSSSKFLNC